MRLHPEEIDERKTAFQRFWRRKALPEVAKVRPVYQGVVHALVKMAFNAGANFERCKHEPERLGGLD